jgi:hypothetical protein
MPSGAAYSNYMVLVYELAYGSSHFISHMSKARIVICSFEFNNISILDGEKRTKIYCM